MWEPGNTGSKNGHGVRHEVGQPAQLTKQELKIRSNQTLRGQLGLPKMTPSCSVAAIAARNGRRVGRKQQYVTRRVVALNSPGFPTNLANITSYKQAPKPVGIEGKGDVAILESLVDEV